MVCYLALFRRAEVMVSRSADLTVKICLSGYIKPAHGDRASVDLTFTTMGTPRMAEATKSRAGSLHLVGGAPCLDFANTASGRGAPASLEHLRRYDDLLAWSAHGGGLPNASRRALALAAAKAPRHAENVLRRAIRLREAIRDIVMAVARGAPADPGQAALITHEAAAAIAVARLAHVQDRICWICPDDASDLARPLWPLARSAFELIQNIDPHRLKLCPAADCGWIFVDRSKNNSRRWCDMRVCGNRAKARRHYRRAGPN